MSQIPNSPPRHSVIEQEVSSDQVSAYTHPTMALRHVRGYSSYLSGKIKTIIDAAIEDPQRRKALKDLVHNSIWTEGYTPVMEWAQECIDRENRGANQESDPAFPFGDFDNSYPRTEE